MKGKKILIIVIMLIIVIAVVSAIFGYLYMTTDLLKSNQDLFSKYFNQNIEIIETMKESNTYSTYENLKNEGTYESNIEIKVTNSEGGEISNPINNLSGKINTKRDNANEYLYQDAQILYNDEEYLEVELIKDKEILGIRFPDVVKQFVTVKNDENIEDIAEDIGVETIQLESYMNILNGTESVLEQFLTKEEFETLKQKYYNIIIENLQNAKYSNQKKSVITVNNATIETNAYSLILSQDQVGNIIMQTLNNIKTDNIILQKAKMFGKEDFAADIDKIIEELSDYEKIYELKITVYEKKGATVRTVVEYGSNKIIFEDSFENNETKIKIQKSKLNTDEINEQIIEISKSNTESQEILNFVINNTKGDENNTISFSSNTQLSNNQIIIDTELKYIKGINSTSIKSKNTTNILNVLENKFELDGTNNVILSDLDVEKRKYIIELLKEKVPEKFEIRIELLKQALGLNSNEQQQSEPNENEMTQVEINRFNAKFEFYTGDSVSAENVKTLLEIVKNNIGSAEITTIGESEGNTKPEDLPINMKITIEKDKQNDELMNQILEKVKDKKKYQILIKYKEENNLIDYITITEISDR